MSIGWYNCQLFHETHHFFEVFQINETNGSSILILPPPGPLNKKKPQKTDSSLFLKSFLKNRTSGYQQNQIGTQHWNIPQIPTSSKVKAPEMLVSSKAV
jgi:hypothetical protein